MTIQAIAKGAARMAGVRVTRWRPANRFDAMRDALELLSKQRYGPRAIIDAGANVGSWSRLAHGIFPGARFFLIEPQPACQSSLQRTASVIGDARVYAVAVSAPGRSRLGLVGGTAEGGTGVAVVEAGDGVDAELECEAVTLDSLLAGAITRADRALLKLDLETHEVAALQGARELLGLAEVVIVESQIYEINDNGRPVLRDIFDVMNEARFELYDIAAMNGRRRDGRLRMLDAIFVRADSLLNTDRGWE